MHVFKLLYVFYNCVAWTSYKLRAVFLNFMTTHTSITLVSVTDTLTHSLPSVHSRVNVNPFCSGITRFNPALLPFWTTAIICRIYDITFSAVIQVNSSNPPLVSPSPHVTIQKLSENQLWPLESHLLSENIEIIIENTELILYRLKLWIVTKAFIIINAPKPHVYLFIVFEQSVVSGAILIYTQENNVTTCCSK